MNGLVFEDLECRLTPALFAGLTGVEVFISTFASGSTNSTVVPTGVLAFSGSVLGLHANLVEGRTATIVFEDGVRIAGRVRDNGDGTADVLVARDLPLSGTLTGELCLVDVGDPNDRIVVGFQIAVALENAFAPVPRAVVQSTPTYSQAEPPIEPPVQTPQPAAPITQAPFEAGSTRTAEEFGAILGKRTFVPLATISPSSSRVPYNGLGYSFLRSLTVKPIDVVPDARRSIEAIQPSGSARHVSAADRSAIETKHEAFVLHGVEVERENGVDDLLLRIAYDNTREAVWMETTETEQPTEATDRRPYWALAAFLGVGATQHFRRRDGVRTEREWI
jgi:hypothetical protein